MTQNSTITLKITCKGDRLDSYLSSNCKGLTRSGAQKLIEAGKVRVNGEIKQKRYICAENDVVEVEIPTPVEDKAIAQEIPLDIVYEDEHLLVVNKPKGMVVHPAAGNREGTLVNALLAHCKGQLSGINGVIRPGIVHRIDKDTSGLLIVAKTDSAHVKLAEQIKMHSFMRVYNAVLCGRLKQEKFDVDKPIARSKKDRKKMAVDIEGRNALTHFEVLTQYEKYALVKCTLETGRTHQIRVHSSYIGHPVAGDAVYGKAEKGLVGQCLHAKQIGFVHPITGEYVEFDSELPEYFTSFIKTLK